MNHRELVTATLTEETAIEWMRAQGYINTEKSCSLCDRLMKVVRKKGGEYFRCPKCRTERSIFYGSIFKFKQVKVNQLLDLLYFWSSNALQVEAAKEARVARKTVNAWYMKCRVVCYEIMRRTKQKKIGGPGVIVQVDESKFSKRKYNVGRLVRSCWVVGGIDDFGETFFVEVFARSTEIIDSIFNEYVLPGSIIFTDGWKGYGNLNSMGYFHYTVNHSKNFVNPVTGVHTQRIENLWCCVKKSIRRRCLTNMCDFSLYFLEYCFKKKYNDAVFETFLKFSGYVLLMD